MASGKNKKKRKGGKRVQLTAKTADKHDLYERSVQEVSVDVKFIRRVFKKKNGRRPHVLREDFCGTAALCAAWVEKDPENTAFGLDLDAPTLAYGTERHIQPLGDEAASRVRLYERDVLEGANERADVCVAFNFSFCVFKDRPTLVRYYRKVLEGLKEGGAFMLDLHGGPEAQIEVEEETDHGEFTYVWDQRAMDALSAEAIRHIHFRFHDGSEMRKAFTYDWRVWTLPEMRDMLIEAGFSSVDVYWEGSDKHGEGNGVFRKVARAENEDSWIAYIVAWV
ncbi:MAG: class I SAM-dependent methyltransferase [Myxococcota bacterium]